MDVATAKIGDTVYTLQATDIDNDEIKYSILSDSLSDYFLIDERKKRFLVNCSLEL